MGREATARLDFIEAKVLPWLTPRERWLWDRLAEGSTPWYLAAMWGEPVSVDVIAEARRALAETVRAYEALFAVADVKVIVETIRRRTHLRKSHRLVTLLLWRRSLPDACRLIGLDAEATRRVEFEIAHPRDSTVMQGFAQFIAAVPREIGNAEKS